MQDLFLPPSGQNNVWFDIDSTKTVFVFVHGILSDSRTCWLHTNPKTGKLTYWPHLIRSDPRLGRPSIFLGGYYTAINAGAYEIRHCADELFKAMVRRGSNGEEEPLAFARIVFICHSTGGIVARYLLDKEIDSFRNKEVGVVLIASPSYGAKLASKLDLLAQFYNQQLGIQLQWGSWSLRDLDARFKDLVHQRRIPNLHGIEAYENHFVMHRRYLPDRYLVVTEDSAGRYFGAPILLRNTDHFSCVKPDGPNHPAHELLLDFWMREFETERTWAENKSRTTHRIASEERVVMYVGVGELIEAQDSKRELTAQDRTDNFMIRNLILNKYGFKDQKNILVFSNESVALTTAKQLFADLATSAGEFRFDRLRIGVGYGTVEDSTGGLGSGILDAQHVAVDPVLDRVGYNHGILVSRTMIERFGEPLREQFPILQAGVGAGKFIYSLSFDKHEPSTTRVEIVTPLPQDLAPYIVCIGMVRATLKVSAPVDELSDIGQRIATERLDPLVSSLNEFEASVGSMVNYLLFPDAERAWHAAVKAFVSSRDSETWDDTIAFRVNVCIHRGVVKLLGNRFSGPGVEAIDFLLRIESSDRNILVSSDAKDGIAELDGVELKKGYDPQAGAFYLSSSMNISGID